MLKQSHYKIGCDAHPGPARQGGQALFALCSVRPTRQARQADPGEPRASGDSSFPLPIPAGYPGGPGNRGQLVLDRG